MNQSLPLRIARAVLPFPARAWLRAHKYLLAWPPVGHVRFGNLRRTTPISPNFGFERGLPIDRHYIEGFLERHKLDIRGAALEFQDDAYLRRFGGTAVASTEIMNYAPGHPGATITGDLAVPHGLPQGRFDCIICTGVLQLIYDVQAAVANLHSMLRPGGVILATLPSVTRICRDEGWMDQWRFTSDSAKTLFENVFGPGLVEIETYGNPLTGAAFLMGLATADLRREELDARERDFEVVVGVRAQRAGSPEVVETSSSQSVEKVVRILGSAGGEGDPS